MNGREWVLRLVPTALLGAAFLAFYDRALSAPMITAVAADLAVPPEDAARAVTIYVLAYAATQVPWAAVSGRIGQLRTLALATVIAAAAAVLSAVAWDIAAFTLSRALAGAALAAIVPSILVHIGDTLAGDRRALAAVNLATALSLGMTVGTALSAALTDWWSWRAAFASSGALGAAVCLVLAWGAASDRARRRVAFWPAFPVLARSGWTWIVLLLAVAEGVVLVGVINFIPVALESVGVPVSIAGFAVAGFGIAVVVWSPVVRMLVGRLSAPALLGIGGAAAVVGYGILVLTLSVAGGVAAVVLLGFAWACAHTQLQTWVTDVVADARPLGMALFAVALFGGGVLGTSLGTWALAGAQFRTMFAISCAVAAGFAITAVLLRRRYVPRSSV